MISVCIDSWPQLFEGFQRDIFGETIVHIIFNTGPGTNLAEMKVYEARQKLREVCNVHPPPQLDTTGLIREIIELVESKMRDEGLLILARKSLVLIARHHDYSWSFNHVVRRVMEMIGRKKCANDLDNKLVIKWVVQTLGSILRLLPKDSRENVENIFNQLLTIINDKDTDADLEDACLQSIASAGHHMPVQVCKFLVNWKPRFKLREETENILATYVGTRGKNFAQRTVDIQRKAKARNRRNRV